MRLVACPLAGSSMRKIKKMAAVDSVNAALNCDDILCEILLRLPPALVFRAIIVSKRWLHFICSSSFGHNYQKKWRVGARLLGFIVCNHLYLGRRRNGVRRPSSEPALPLLSTCKEGDDLKSSKVLKQLGYFIDSSNGLLLCGRHPKRYVIWNPVANKQYKLPHPRVYFEDLCMAFLVEDSLSDDDLHYKVVRAKCECRLDATKTVTIETFNSKTSTWNYSTLTCSSTLSLCPWTVASVIKGVIHWYAEQGNVAIYDPQQGEKRIELLKLPGSYDFDERVLGESFEGSLQYGWSDTSGVEIWVHEKDLDSYSGISSNGIHSNNKWNLRYKVGFKAMWKRNPALMAKFISRSKETQILAFLLQNSEAVFIKSGTEIFLLHLESKTVELVHYNGPRSSISWDFIRVAPYFWPAWPDSSLCHSGETKS